MKFKKGDKVKFVNQEIFDEWSDVYSYDCSTRELELNATYTIGSYESESEQSILIEETNWWYWPDMFELAHEPGTVNVISATDAYGGRLTATELQSLNADFNIAIKEKAKSTHYDNSFPIKRKHRDYAFDNSKYNKLR